MKHPLLPASLLATLLFAACATPRPVVPAPDPVHAFSQQNVNAALYQNASAEVAWLFEQAYAHARLKLDANLARPDTTGLPPAVIVDVDETVLDNSPYEMENLLHGRTYAPHTWKAWTARAAAAPIPGALAFLRYAAERGCAVFYITNRETDEQGPTIANLARYGFPMADSAHVMTMAGTSDKTPRRELVKRTHRVVLYVGDQLTDYDQALKDRSNDLGLPAMYAMREALEREMILLPNVAYGYWRDAITGRGTAEEKMERVRQFIEQRVP